MIIQPRMSVQVRTKEELDVLVEVCEKEGHLFADGTKVTKNRCLSMHNLPFGIQCHSGSSGIRASGDITIGYSNTVYGKATNLVEASQLFRNQLISKRLK